ncbi:MAG: PAS domain-containing protein [Lachnospiraceae bacterium]|nr:PAS domain-containing protein [Lachnospiraceae bacterium]
MVHPEDYDKIQASIDDQIADTGNQHNMDYVVYRIIRKDGTVRWVDDYGHFATLPGYGEVYYVFIGDITDTRLAAEEKERAEGLALALEAAEQANVAKIAFLSNMSHEIRTPITAILGMNEMIQREAEAPGILEYSENIRKAGVSLLGIISDILDFSKIETGRMELQNEDYSLSSVLVDLYNLVRFRTEAKGLDLEFSIDPSLPRILFGDEIKVKQIISNLLTNAAKYTEKGRVVFEMKLEEKLSDSVRIAVSVTDTGIGIRKEDMERLFEPFDRLDPKKTRSIEGSGLGLAITRQLLSLMGSDLKVESKYEEGSKFFFILTQKAAVEKPIGPIDIDRLAHENPDSSRKHALFTAPGMKLLVEDDTPMNLQVIAGLLKRTRMHIDVAVSGEECIKKFGADH